MEIDKAGNVALFTAEAEYVALSVTVTERLCLKQLLYELKMDYKRTVMFEDNRNAILLSNSGNLITNVNTWMFDISF